MVDSSRGDVVIQPYRTAREHLDDVAANVVRRFDRYRRLAGARGEADARALAELELDIARRDELIEARVEATAAAGPPLPLDQLRDAFQLSPTEMRLLAMLAAIELVPTARRAMVAAIDGGELVVELAESVAATDMAALGDDGPLFRHRLVTLEHLDRPWLAREIRIAARVGELAMGRWKLDAEIAGFARLVDAPPSSDHLIVEDRVRAMAAEAIARRRSDLDAPILELLGAAGSGRATVALGVAHDLELRAVVVDARALPADDAAYARALRAIVREATLFRAMIVIRDLDALIETSERVSHRIANAATVLGAYHGPVIVTSKVPAWPRDAACTAVVVELPVLDERAREQLWHRALGAASEAIATRAAERYRITGGVLLRAASFAMAQAEARSEPVALSDIRVAIRDQLDDDLATLGRRVDWRQTWDDVVLPDDVEAELRELVSRIRHRRRVLDDWGFAQKVGKGVGVSAMFSGPPGTGKTMVAGIVANELELDLYQIDVSRMVSKWVGETEKNLARLFDAAGAGHAVLLFDEADSLFAKRTEVKSSSDRYANLEVNYLLQRMEAFDGVTILTTNLDTSVDDAFRRRLAFRITFPVPERDERERLWRAMLPQKAEVAADINFDALANRYEMTGGYIRNAVIRAAYLAAADGQSIAMRHLHRAATLEYTAMGKIIHHDSTL